MITLRGPGTSWMPTPTAGPAGGPDDWRALFHEAGHTEHFANTSPSLKMEEKRLGDNAVTEGWAMLMEHLTIEPAWLERRLDFPRPHEFAAEGATQLLWDTYHPYTFWYPFVAVGLVSAAGVGVYARIASEWTTGNA